MTQLKSLETIQIIENHFISLDTYRKTLKTIEHLSKSLKIIRTTWMALKIIENHRKLWKTMEDNGKPQN